MVEYLKGESRVKIREARVEVEVRAEVEIECQRVLLSRQQRLSIALKFLSLSELLPSVDAFSEGEGCR